MTKPLTKPELIEALGAELGCEKKHATAAFDAICTLIAREVAGRGAVVLPGVGKIFCRERPARTARNPKTGEQIHKDADRVVKMTVAKALKDGVNA